MRYNHFTMLPERAFRPLGGRMALEGGGGGDSPPPAQPTQSTVTNTNLPDYAQPAMTELIGKSQALTNTNTNPFVPYGGQRVAEFQPLQNQAFGQLEGMQPSVATGQAAAGAQGIAGLASNLQGYNPAQFNVNQVAGQNVAGQNVAGQNVAGQNVAGQNVDARNVAGQNIDANQSQVAVPTLQNYQMQGPQNVTAQQTGTQSFTDPNVAASYMNPYMRNVVDFQTQEAARQSAIQGLGIDSKAAGMGAFGGSRQGLMQAQRIRDLGTLQGGIAATGAANAYNAGAQNFQTDQGRGLQSQMANQGAGIQAGLANQQMGYNVGAQNLGANLATQQLGSGQQLQAGLANQQVNMQGQLANQQNDMRGQLANQESWLKAGMSNQQNNMQGQLANQQNNMQGQLANQQNNMQGQLANQQVGMQGQLANQQVGMQGQLANQQANMSAQQQAEQSRQFGQNLGLQGLQTGLQANQLMGNMGQQDYAQRMGINAAQQAAGTTQQQNVQQGLNNQYQDYATQQNYPYKQLGFMSDILHGASGTQAASSMYQAPPTNASNLAALGLGAYGVSNLLGSGKKEGGIVGLAAGGALSDRFVHKSLQPGATALNPVDAMRIAQMRGMQRTAMAPMQPQEITPFQVRMDQGVAQLGADPTVGMAEGGILGFAGRGVVPPPTAMELMDAAAREKKFQESLARRQVVAPMLELGAEAAPASAAKAAAPAAAESASLWRTLTAPRSVMGGARVALPVAGKIAAGLAQPATLVPTAAGMLASTVAGAGPAAGADPLMFGRALGEGYARRAPTWLGGLSNEEIAAGDSQGAGDIEGRFDAPQFNRPAASSAPPAAKPPVAPPPGTGITRLRSSGSAHPPASGYGAAAPDSNVSPEMAKQIASGEGEMGIDAILEKSIGVEKKLRENDPTGKELQALRDEVKARTAKREAGSSKDLGLMALTAAKEFAQPGRSFVTAAGNAAGAVGEKALTLAQNKEAADRLDQDAEMKIAQAQILDRKGDKETARKMVADAIKDKNDSQRHRDQVKIAEAQTAAIRAQTAAQERIGTARNTSVETIARMRVAALNVASTRAETAAIETSRKLLTDITKNMTLPKAARDIALKTLADKELLREHAMGLLARQGAGIAAAAPGFLQTDRADLGEP